MDAFCWFVRPGLNDELKYSIRSVHAQFPNVPIYIVGDVPEWVQGVHFLKGNLRTDKPLNVWDNLVLLTAWDEVPENIVVMMDDIYLTAPVNEFPVQYRTTLEDHINRLGKRSDWWARSLKHTAELLGPDALSYELHTPFPCKKSLMRETLSIDPGLHPPQWRTLYGNQWHTNPDKARDVKIAGYNPGATLQTPFTSSTDISFRYLRKHLDALYPTPSPYEHPGEATQCPPPVQA